MLQFLVLLNLALAGFDAYLSGRRIREYSVSVELNAVIRKLARTLGPELGATVGVLIPAAGMIGLFAFFKWAIPLALLAGYRLHMFVIQLQSIAFEAECRAIKKKLSGK